MNDFFDQYFDFHIMGEHFGKSSKPSCRTS